MKKLSEELRATIQVVLFVLMYLVTGTSLEQDIVPVNEALIFDAACIAVLLLIAISWKVKKVEN